MIKRKGWEVKYFFSDVYDRWLGLSFDSSNHRYFVEPVIRRTAKDYGDFG